MIVINKRTRVICPHSTRRQYHGSDGTIEESHLTPEGRHFYVRLDSDPPWAELHEFYADELLVTVPVDTPAEGTYIIFMD